MKDIECRDNSSPLFLAFIEDCIGEGEVSVLKKDFTKVKLDI